MKTIQKTFSILLAVIMLLSLAVPTLAATNSGASVTHIHDYSGAKLQSTRYESGGDSTCICVQTYYGRCKICNEPGTYTDSTYGTHSNIASSATCNGTIQTLKYVCANCSHVTVNTNVCPAAGHAAGQCPALPF